MRRRERVACVTCGDILGVTHHVSRECSPCLKAKRRVLANYTDGVGIGLEVAGARLALTSEEARRLARELRKAADAADQDS